MVFIKLQIGQSCFRSGECFSDPCCHRIEFYNIFVTKRITLIENFSIVQITADFSMVLSIIFDYVILKLCLHCSKCEIPGNFLMRFSPGELFRIPSEVPSGILPGDSSEISKEVPPGIYSRVLAKIPPGSSPDFFRRFLLGFLKEHLLRLLRKLLDSFRNCSIYLCRDFFNTSF